MDAAQMLTAQEIARQCEQLARTEGQRKSVATPVRHLRPADPVTEPIPRVVEPIATSSPELAAEIPSADGALDERERGILAFERQWWKRSGAKERAIRELFDMSSSRYYQLLNAILDRPEAFRADPMLVKRLRKVRASRQRARAARRLGIELH
ncbi:DUF3263 domain-containing protein [Allosaccharopolyspora coralli]|uniref:DUF3263 domain-containing protein n=1 Tax=Allosaccharopolyspora coralli TaxID=2665642 RepID=A0A5Q3QAM7_9PSEU|nr:DUF3263 domain-containing protein [Allosaccharopolyspora coralli]QGK68525.1 DUF3263 domain-containing protein [Allosaccharopolyspora coralli]